LTDACLALLRYTAVALKPEDILCKRKLKIKMPGMAETQIRESQDL